MSGTHEPADTSSMEDVGPFNGATLQASECGNIKPSADIKKVANAEKPSPQNADIRSRTSPEMNPQNQLNAQANPPASSKNDAETKDMKSRATGMGREEYPIISGRES